MLSMKLMAAFKEESEPADPTLLSLDHHQTHGHTPENIVLQRQLASGWQEAGRLSSQPLHTSSTDQIKLIRCIKSNSSPLRTPQKETDQGGTAPTILLRCSWLSSPPKSSATPQYSNITSRQNHSKGQKQGDAQIHCEC